MKYFVATLSGFVLTLATFAGGFMVAIAFLNAEPVSVRSPYKDVSGVWTREPARVNAAEQELARLPAQPSSVSSSAAAAQEAAPADTAIVSNEGDAVEGDSVDTTTTAAVPNAALQPEQPVDSTMIAAHLEWCSEHYRSYRPETNTYRPYSGGQRECISPFFDALVDPEGGLTHVMNSGGGSSVAHVVEDTASGYGLSPEHIKSCIARYRSYRPEDNSYQPYGGGPRRQCK